MAPNFWYYGDILKKYTETNKGEELWRAQWQRSQTQCIHGEKCKRENCEVGKAVQTVNIVSGQFVVLWGFLTECVPRGKRPRLVQVQVQASAAQSATQSVAKNDKARDTGVETDVAKNDKGVKTEVETKETKKDKEIKTEPKTPTEEPLLITGVRILPGSIARLRSRLAVMQEQQEKAGGCRARV